MSTVLSISVKRRYGLARVCHICGNRPSRDLPLARRPPIDVRRR